MMASLRTEEHLDASTKQRNPFRRSQLGLDFKYCLDERDVEVRGVRLQAFQRIFQERSVELDFISELVAVNVVELSSLPKDQLADLWDDALRAKIECSGIPGTKEGYLNRYEFFVLLSELQAKLGMPDEGFQSLFTINVDPKAREPVDPKRNPFQDPVHVFTLSSSKSPDSRLGEPDSNAADGAAAANTDSAVDFLSTTVQRPSDGYAEYTQNFGIPFLPTSGVDVFASKPPIAKVISSATSSSYDQRVNGETSTQDQVVLDRKRQSLLMKAGAQAPELVVDAAMYEKESIVLGDISRSDDPASDEVISSQRHMMSRTALVIPRIVRPGLHEMGEPVSTSESDKMALERLRALDPDAPKVVFAKSKKRFSMTPFRSSKIKQHTSLSKNVPEKATSGFKLAVLAQALQDAVTEGNLPLTASLIDLGADINFLSVKNKTYHHILGIAVATGHRRVIDYLIACGSDGASVDNALLSAFYTGSLDLLPKLVPHTNMYHMNQVDSIRPTSAKAESTSGSSLGLIARDETMPRELRIAFLKAFIEDKRFDPNKVVLRTYDLINGHLYEYTTITTLVHRLDIGILRAVLALPSKTITRLSSSSIQCPTAIQCLRPINWKYNPVRTLGILKLLASEMPKQYLNLPSHWPGEGPLSPFACAISGGSLDGTKYLLSVSADPETLTFVSLDGGRTG